MADIKLYNVVLGFDLFIYAESQEAAMAAGLQIIRDPQELPGERWSLEVRKARDIPPRLQGVLPFVTEAAAEHLETKGVDLDKDDVGIIYGKLTGQGPWT